MHRPLNRLRTWSYGPDLTGLAETVARLNRREFMLVIAPPRAPGAGGYPVNPLAMF
ncbi:MAG: hypothetical protein ABL993_14720 [Vicinamibacterales bacterium]